MFQRGQRVMIVGGYWLGFLEGASSIPGTIYDSAYTAQDGDVGYRVQLEGTSFVVPVFEKHLEDRETFDQQIAAIAAAFLRSARETAAGKYLYCGEHSYCTCGAPTNGGYCELCRVVDYCGV